MPVKRLTILLGDHEVEKLRLAREQTGPPFAETIRRAIASMNSGGPANQSSRPPAVTQGGIGGETDHQTRERPPPTVQTVQTVQARDGELPADQHQAGTQ